MRVYHVVLDLKRNEWAFFSLFLFPSGRFLRLLQLILRYVDEGEREKEKKLFLAYCTSEIVNVIRTYSSYGRRQYKTFHLSLLCSILREITLFPLCSYMLSTSFSDLLFRTGYVCVHQKING